jgi:4-hydroxy-3-polyprenylbenzoate decarboxylase
MAYKDLADFIRACEKRGEVIRISAAIERELEITEITDRIFKRGKGEVLIFENVKGADFPLVINLFGPKNARRWPSAWTTSMTSPHASLK